MIAVLCPFGLDEGLVSKAVSFSVPVRVLVPEQDAQSKGGQLALLLGEILRILQRRPDGGKLALGNEGLGELHLVEKRIHGKEQFHQRLEGDRLVHIGVVQPAAEDVLVIAVDTDDGCMKFIAEHFLLHPLTRSF